MLSFIAKTATPAPRSAVGTTSSGAASNVIPYLRGSQVAGNRLDGLLVSVVLLYKNIRDNI
jgi:hypothetical protein